MTNWILPGGSVTIIVGGQTVIVNNGTVINAIGNCVFNVESFESEVAINDYGTELDSDFGSSVSVVESP